MFKLQRENTIWKLYDIPSNIVFVSTEIKNPLFIAFAVSKIRKEIKNGKVDGGFEMEFSSTARVLSQNTQVINTMVQATLKGTLTTKAQTMDLDGDICKTCGGTGETATLESVYRNEPHQALVGTRACPDCQDLEPDDFSGASNGDR